MKKVGDGLACLRLREGDHLGCFHNQLGLSAYPKKLFPVANDKCKFNNIREGEGMVQNMTHV